MSKNIKGKKPSKQSRYLPEIDGLRAFAVIAVIINHFNKAILPNGYLGVDIFFVISGFVITSSLYQRRSKNFKDFIIGFYERRIKRLVPALSVFVLIMSIAICLFNPQPGTSLKTGLTSLFGVSNLYLIKQSTNYFAQSTELNPFTHTWSLGVEEQFYILFPVLIWFSGFGRQTKNGNRNLLIIIGTLAITSLIGFLYLYLINQSAAYFLMPTRFWEMASGCLLFLGVQKRRSLEQFLEKVPPVLSMGLIVGVMYLPKSWAAASTIAVVVLSVILIASLKKGTRAFALFTHPKIVYTGLISYSLYLWHWGVLSISRWTIGIHWWSAPIQVALILSLSLASYKYIETPLRNGKWFGRKRKTLIVGGGILVTLSSLLIALDKPLKGKLFSGKNITSEAERNLLEGEACLKNISNETQCFFIDNKSNQTLWMIGDSHTRYLKLTGERVANSLGINLKLFSAGGTAFPPVKKYQKSNRKKELQRVDDFKLVEKELYKGIKVGDFIYLSMRMPYHFGGIYYAYPPSEFIFIKDDGSLHTQENAFEDWGLAVVNLAKIAQKKGAKIIIQTPTPEWEKQYINPRCSTLDKQWFNSLMKTNCQIESRFFIDEETGLYNHLFKKLIQLSRSNENIFLFDTYKIVCPSSMCSFTVDGIDIFGDTNHIRHEWARDFISPKIYKLITDIQNTDK